MLTGGIGYTYALNGTQPFTEIDLAAPYTYKANKTGGLIVAAPDVWKVATGYTGRRSIVSTAKCNACHVQLGATPTFHAGQRNDAPTCSFCHNPNRTSSGWSANVKDFIHALHGGRARTVAFDWHAPSATDNYGEVEFPSPLNNCEACHLAGTYDFSLSYKKTANDQTPPTPNTFDATSLSNFLWSTTAAYTSTAPASYTLSPYVSTAATAFTGTQANTYADATYGFGFSAGNVTVTVNDGRVVTAGTQKISSTVTNVCTPSASCK